ncbi:MAG TPA: T9SS type A sorting domain-containing protein, partial [Bacteroidia bacterium]|nr:T9SS type A sorting domain-containing protein [Bacteroidia bacterium]
NLAGGYSGDGGMATAAQLNQPTGMVQDGSGNVYIADLSNSRIRLVDKTGIITTYAGTGANGYNGDGFYAVSAELYYPSGLALDAYNNLYIADMYNNRIRKVSAPLGINELTNPAEIITYPQPCNGNFNIKVTGCAAEIKNIEVYDMLGEKLYSQAVNSVQDIFKLELNLNNGIYILQVKTSKGIFDKRIEVIK